MKRGFKLLVLVLVLAVLAGGYIFLKSLDLNGEREPESTEIVLRETAQEDIVSLSWSYGTDMPAFVKSEEGWKLEGDDKFPVKQSAVESLTAKLASITAEQAVTVINDINDYGFDEPGLTVSYKTTDGTEDTLVFGDVNSLTGAYYTTLNGDTETVYLINEELPKAFMKGLKDMLAYESIPAVEFENVSMLTVSDARGARGIIHLNGDNRKAYSSRYTRFYTENEDYFAVDNDKAKALINKVLKIKFSDCVTYDATPEQLEEYGLREPALRVTAEYVKGEGLTDFLTLEFGSYTGRSCYVRLEGSEMVYLADADVLDSLALMSYKSLRPDDICLMDWDTVERMDISLEGKLYTLIIETEHIKDAEGKDQTARTFMYRDKLLDAQKGQALLDAIYNLQNSGEAEGEAGRGEQLSFTFHRNTETFKEMTLSFYAYDSGNSLVGFNGEKRLLVDSEAVTGLIDMVKALLG